MSRKIQNDPGLSILLIEEVSGAIAGRLVDRIGDLTRSSVVDGLAVLAAKRPAVVLFCMESYSVLNLGLVTAISGLDARRPLILIGSHIESSQILPFLDAGGTDFLVGDALAPDVLDQMCKRKGNQYRKLRVQTRTLNRRQMAVENLQDSLAVIEQDQKIGANVQRLMMPDSPWVLRSFRVAHDIRPALILSGDFIDYGEMQDGRLLFCLADVSGHGAGSAFVTVLLSELFKRFLNQRTDSTDISPESALSGFNQQLCNAAFEQHVTMLIGVVDEVSNHLDYACAGHFPPAILRTGDEAQFLNSGGLPLGLLRSAEYHSQHLTLPDQFELLVCSDGVFEGIIAESLEDKERHLMDFVAGNNGRFESFLTRLFQREGEPLSDDAAVLSILRES